MDISVATHWIVCPKKKKALFIVGFFIHFFFSFSSSLMQHGLTLSHRLALMYCHIKNYTCSNC